MKIVGDLSRWLAISTIGGYQRWLSPHKGFRCAHRVVHGGLSCSQFVKQSIASRPWLEIWEVSRDRFAACARASRYLQMQRNRDLLPGGVENPRRRRQTPCLNECCGAGGDCGFGRTGDACCCWLDVGDGCDFVDGCGIDG